MGSRARSALIAAAACAGGLLGTWLLAFRTSAGAHVDQRIYAAVVSRRTPVRVELADRTAHLADPGTFVLLAAGVLALPLLRRRWTTAAVVAAMLTGANLTTQALQELTAGQRDVFALPLNWPSGHTTAAASLAFGLLLGAPRALRLPVAIVAGALTITMGWAVVVRTTHLPSDVVAAVLVCGIWAALAEAVLARRSGRVRAAGA